MQKEDYQELYSVAWEKEAILMMEKYLNKI